MKTLLSNSRFLHSNIYKIVQTTFIFVFLLLVLTCAKYKTFEKADFTINRNDGTEITINLELARTQTEKQQGFMHRKNIPDGTGMLFIYDKDLKMSFWMKNTPTALSIAFIDSRGRIREIHDLTPLSTQTTESTHSVRYALEVPQGWFQKNSIQVGDTLDLTPLNLD